MGSDMSVHAGDNKLILIVEWKIQVNAIEYNIGNSIIIQI